MSTFISAADFSLTAENEAAWNKVAELYEGCLTDDAAVIKNDDGSYRIGDPEEINFFEGDVPNSYLSTLESLVSLCTTGSYIVVRDFGLDDGWARILNEGHGSILCEWKPIKNPFMDA